MDADIPHSFNFDFDSYDTDTDTDTSSDSETTDIKQVETKLKFFIGHQWPKAIADKINTVAEEMKLRNQIQSDQEIAERIQNEINDTPEGVDDDVPALVEEPLSEDEKQGDICDKLNIEYLNGYITNALDPMPLELCDMIGSYSQIPQVKISNKNVAHVIVREGIMYTFRSNESDNVWITSSSMTRIDSDGYEDRTANITLASGYDNMFVVKYGSTITIYNLSDWMFGMPLRDFIMYRFTYTQNVVAILCYDHYLVVIPDNVGDTNHPITCTYRAPRIKYLMDAEQYRDAIGFGWNNKIDNLKTESTSLILNHKHQTLIPWKQVVPPYATGHIDLIVDDQTVLTLPTFAHSAQTSFYTDPQIIVLCVKFDTENFQRIFIWNGSCPIPYRMVFKLKNKDVHNFAHNIDRGSCLLLKNESYSYIVNYRNPSMTY